MAILRTWDKFDLRALDFGSLLYNSFDSFLDPEAFVVQGVTYEGGYVLISDQAETEAIEFYGNGLTFVEGESGFSGGTIEGVYRWWRDEGSQDWFFDIALRGFQIAAQDLTDAMETISTRDDQRLIRQIFSGDDSVRLWTRADWFDGKAGHDTINGGGGADTLFGGAGRDSIVGGTGDDLLQGGGKADRLQGDAGEDTMAGGGGNDRLTGGDGADVFLLWSGAGREVVTDFEDGADRIQFMNGPTRFADLTITDLGADTQITHGTETVILRGIDASQIAASDFLFG